MHLGGSANTRVSSFVARKTSHPKAKGRPRASRGVALLLGVSLAALTSGTAFAATDTWVGGSSVNWSDAGNWNPGAPATTGDSVILAQTGSTAPSTQNISGLTLNSLTFQTAAGGTNSFTNGYNIGDDNIAIASGGSIIDNAANQAADQINVGVALNGPATIALGPGATGLTFDQAITGTGGLTINNQSSAGSLIFLGNNTYSGNTTITAGTLQLGNGTTFAQISGNVNMTGANTGLIFNEISGTGYGFTGNITGQGSVTQEGAATTITLSGTNTYSGGTNISAGTISVSSNANLGSGPINFTNTTVTDAALVFSASGTFTQAISLGTVGGTIDTMGNTDTLSGNITGTGALSVNNAIDGGTLILTGASNTYSGGTTINSGTLQIGTDSVQGSISASGNIANSGALDFHNLTSSVFDYGGVISGTGTVSIDNGTVVYTNINTYGGTTTIGSNGTLQIGAGAAVGGISQADVIVDNGKLFFANVGSSAELDGGITGTGSVTVSLQHATDTLILTGTNSYASGSTTAPDTTVNEGVLQIGNLGSSLTGSLAGNVSLNTNGTLDFNDIDPAHETFSGFIRGTGTLQLDSGTLILTNAGNVLTNTNITGGTLQIGDGTSTGSLFSTFITNNGTLAFDPPTGQTLTINGAISGTGGLDQIGSGTTDLTGASSFTGNSTIAAGTLEFGSGSSFTGAGTFTVDSGATLAFGSTSSFTFGSVITGAGNVSVMGPTILTNTDDYSGTTTISSSSLQVGNSTTAGAITGTSAVSIAAGANLSFVNSSSPTFGAPISGAGSVTVDLASGSSIAFTGNNTYSGGTNLEGGTLQVASASNLGIGPGTVNFTNGATLQFTSANTFTQGVTVGTGGGTFDTNGNAVTWSGAIANGPGTPGSLTVTDSTAPNSGTFILTANNTYTGGTIITSNGTLQIGNETGKGSIQGPVTDNGFLDFDYGGSTTFAGVISGSGEVSQNDTTGGTLVLSGANTSFSGPVTIVAGKLQVASASNLGDGSSTNYVYMDPGTTLAVSATGAFGNKLYLSGDPTIQVANGTTTTWNGIVVDGATPGTLNVSGGGTLILTDTSNSYSGGTVVLGNSTLSIGSDAVLGASTGGLTLGGTSPNSAGTLAVTQSFTLGSGRAVTVTGAGGTVNTGTGVTFEISSGISGAGSLTASGPGTFVLAGTNTYTGNTNVAAGGTLQLGDGTTAGTIAAGTVVNNNGSLVFDEGGNLEFTNTIQGSGSVTQNDAAGGTLTLTGAETYAGSTTITSGTLQLGDGTTAGTLTGNITDNSALAFDEPSNTAYAGVISGSGIVTVSGTSTLTLTGNNTYSGATTIGTGATLQVGNGGGTGSIGNSSSIVDNGTLTIDTNGTTTLTGGITGTGNLSQVGSGTTILAGADSYGGTTTVSGGTLQIGNGATSGSLTGDITNNAAVAFNRTDTSTYGGKITGTGTVAQAGTGTTILTGNSTYSGTTTITAGTLQIGNGGTSGSITSNVTDNSNLAFDRSDTSTYGGVITGNGNVAQSGTGTTILTGNSTYTGTTTVSSGTLQIGNGGTSGSLTSNITDNSNVTFDRSDSSTYAGNITGTGSLTQAGTGTTALTGTDSYSGGTTISAGTLQLGSSSAAGSITGNVTDNGTLAFDRSNSYVFNGIISGSGGVTQSGSGETTLTAAETYTGATVVNDGTLLVNGAITSSSGTTVNSGGTIGGTGTVGKLTVNNNGTVTTGSGGIGTLTVNGNFILGPGATYAAQVSPTSSDLLNVNGTASVNGALQVTPTGTGFTTTPIDILHASGGLSGTFSSFTVFGNPNQIPILSYGADDAFLTFAPSVSSLLPTSAADTNQGRVGDAIDFALLHDNAIALQAVTGETGTALTQTLSELSGETAVGFQNIAVSSVASFMNTLFDPSVGGRGGLGAGTDGITDNKQLEQLAFNGSNSDVPYQHPSLRAVTIWTSAYGYQDTTDANVDLGTHRTTASQYGGTVGLDYRPKHGDGSLGIAVGMSGNTWNVSDQLGKGEATAYQIGAYYSRRFWDTYFTGGLSYARYSASTDRTVNLGGENLYHADFVSNAVAARAEAGHVFHTDIGLLTPFARFQADDIGVPHYSEQTQAGSAAYALSYTGKQHYDYTTEVGAGWNTLLGQWTDLHARVGWLHDYAGGLSDIATFSEFNGASFTVDGASPPRDAAHIVLGIAHNVNNVVLSLNGETALAGTSTTYGGTASIAYRW
jgi:fibronectin-binding autotransporter adhesin